MPNLNAGPGKRAIARHGDEVTVTSESQIRLDDEWDTVEYEERSVDTKAIFSRPTGVDVERDAINTNRTVDYVVWLRGDELEAANVAIVDTEKADSEDVSATRIEWNGNEHLVILPEERVADLIRVVVTRT